MYLGKWALLLSVFWLLLSGFLKPLLLSFGVISVAIVIYVLRRMDSIDHEPKAVSSGFRMFRYTTWLLKEIANSSLEVAKLVWGSPNSLSPSIAKLPIDDIPEKTRVLYANSITLTPGTLSVDLDDQHVTVHALHEQSIADLKEGSMSSRIKKTWGGSDT